MSIMPFPGANESWKFHLITKVYMLTAAFPSETSPSISLKCERVASHGFLINSRVINQLYQHWLLLPPLNSQLFERCYSQSPPHRLLILIDRYRI